jgi:hypothetical protein
MDLFSFHPELFELRERVLETLAARGYAWLSDYSSVDLLHDVYGIEVCGIREQCEVARITQLLRELFPDWHHMHSYYKDSSTREPGWKIVISRDPENFNDRWEPAG